MPGGSNQELSDADVTDRVKRHAYMGNNTTRIAALLRECAFFIEDPKSIPKARRELLIKDLRHEASQLSK